MSFLDFPESHSGGGRLPGRVGPEGVPEGSRRRRGSCRQTHRLGSLLKHRPLTPVPGRPKDESLCERVCPQFSIPEWSRRKFYSTIFTKELFSGKERELCPPKLGIRKVRELSSIFGVYTKYNFPVRSLVVREDERRGCGGRTVYTAVVREEKESADEPVRRVRPPLSSPPFEGDGGPPVVLV